MLLPETDAQQLLVAGGAVRGVRDRRQGRAARRRAGTRRSSPAPSCTRARPCSPTACRDCSTSAAIEHFGLQGENPQVYALGVKEVWRVARPLDRVIHTLGWPLRAGQALPRVRRVVDLPDGARARLDRLRRRARHDRRQHLGARPAAGAEDAPARAAHPRGRRARLVGREGDPRGRLLVAAGERLAARRRDLRRRGRLRQRAEAEGRALRAALGHARRRDDLRGAARPGRRRLARPARSRCTTSRCARARSGATCGACATCARRSRTGLVVGGALAGAMDATGGAFPPGRLFQKRDAEQCPSPTAAAASRRPTACSRSTSSRASSSRATARATTSPTTSASPTACRG